MAANQYLPWATGAGANTLLPAAYAVRNEVQQGVQVGVADPTLANTTWRQASTIAAMVAQFIADNQTADVLDNGNVSTLEAQLYNALVGYLSPLVQAGQWVYGASSGTNTYTVALFNPSTHTFALTADMEILVYFANANTSTSPTLNVNGTGAKPIVRQGGGATAIGDVTGFVPLIYDGANWRINGLVASDVTSLTQSQNTSSLTYGGRNVSFGAPGSSGTSSWTVPTGVTVVHVRLWGAGGAGGGSYGAGGAGTGGAGGGYAEGTFSVTPGQVIPITIGAGGAGVAGTSGGGGNGNSGGSTSFGSLISATGGGGGGGALNSIANYSSVPGTGTNGTRQVSGGSGGTGFAISGGQLSGVGGSAYTAPGASANTGSGGSPGIFPGGAGAGASTNSNTGYAGGAGANGFISVDY